MKEKMIPRPVRNWKFDSLLHSYAMVTIGFIAYVILACSISDYLNKSLLNVRVLFSLLLFLMPMNEHILQLKYYQSFYFISPSFTHCLMLFVLFFRLDSTAP